MFLNQSGDIVPMLLCLNNQLGEDDSVLTLLFDPTCQSVGHDLIRSVGIQSSVLLTLKALIQRSVSVSGTRLLLFSC